MTRATAQPLRRIVLDSTGTDLVLEVTDRALRLRPKGTRRNGPAEIVVLHGQVYLRAMQARVESERRERARKRGRR